MAQPEVEFVTAALRWVADQSDLLAAAEMARLSQPGKEWFAAAFEAENAAALEACIPFADKLRALRDSVPQLTPAEMFDAVLHVPGVLTAIARWGAMEQRLHNLEAVRVLIGGYQDEQRAERQAATINGLCQWLLTQDSATQPQSRHPDAVQILTYHGAKGLEWPIVILTELESEAKGSPFRLVAENEGDPDWRQPLKGRVLHYWPWPYGDQAKDVGLDAAASASPEGARALATERLERTRLLYVGITRARDHLIFAVTGKSPLWLNELCDTTGAPLVRCTADEIHTGDAVFAARGNAPQPSASPDDQSTQQEFARPTVEAMTYLPLRLRPSAASYSGQAAVAERHILGTRLSLAGDADMQATGEACHRFFACDDRSHAHDHRLDRAAGLLRRWNALHLAPSDLVEASDRLQDFVKSRYGAGRVLHEWPVHATDGQQIIAGRIDLLIDLPDSFVIVDHKSFPGDIDIDGERLVAFAGQASLYARALQRATGRQCREYWLHQPIAAMITRVELTDSPL
jgi:ATP-dependent exoDNAse (exonuclease V) beta subunit